MNCPSPALFAVLLFAHGPLAAAETPDTLVSRLGDDSFVVREAAMRDLAALGEPALPAVERAMSSADSEIRWRAEMIRAMIRRGISPELRAEIGDTLTVLELRPWFKLERAVMDIAVLGGTASVPALARILSDETSDAVRRAAALGLLRLGPEGLLALERCGAEFTGIPPDNAALRIEIGNGFLEEGKFERALVEYRRALQVEPENHIAWYNIACTLSRLQQAEEAIDALRKAIEFGYRDLEWMKRDPDLDHVRGTQGFADLVRELEKKVSPAKR